ncbi:hypothetical protein Taro_041749 [Colocasia esculenta]|uniref:Uncharacterized protein n=1 Tax=Colocasia esculenta TaxID=4460 RepID=A0A843WUH7_COLES|nr:hypothetical protein [Colocasia esculenta]
MAMTGGASALVTLVEHIAHEEGMFYVLLKVDVIRGGGASALVTLVERIAHEAGMFYVVCPGVGTIVIESMVRFYIDF